MNKSRRRFLRGAGALGATSLALPILPSLSKSQDPDFPLRLVVFFSGNGTIHDNWVPEHTGGRITSLSPILQPLERHLSKLLVVDGLETAAGQHMYQPKGGFHGHERGLGAILTGRPLNLGSMVEESGYASGISVDNFIANRLGDESTLGNLAVGLASRRHGGGDFNRDTMSYLGDNDPKFMENDGQLLFNRIFGEFRDDNTAYLRAQRRRQSVLDFVREDLTRLETRISSEDRMRLAKHQDAFRTLERQLSELPPMCDMPDLTDPSSWTSEGNLDAIADFQFAQTVKAMECDRTRVSVMQFGSGLGRFSMGLIGETKPDGSSLGWHEVSHLEDAVSHDRLTRFNANIATYFARLLDAMDNVTEGDGTMLDHSIVCWVNELGDGDRHTYDHVPLVVAGGGHGFFETGGRYVDVGGRANNDFLVSLCHAFGQTDVTEFGLPELNNGPLDMLRA